MSNLQNQITLILGIDAEGSAAFICAWQGKMYRSAVQAVYASARRLGKEINGRNFLSLLSAIDSRVQKMVDSDTAALARFGYLPEGGIDRVWTAPSVADAMEAHDGTLKTLERIF